jgi:hypothetical protein
MFVQVIFLDRLNLSPTNRTLIHHLCISGAKSLLKLQTPDARLKYDLIMTDHQCGKNFSESSGNMEASCILQMFQRSEQKYGVRYKTYVGDGDSKTFSVLLKNQPYKGEN